MTVREAEIRKKINDFSIKCKEEGISSFDAALEVERAAKKFGFNLDRNFFSKHKNILKECGIELIIYPGGKALELRMRKQIVEFTKICKEKGNISFKSIYEAAKYAKEYGCGISNQTIVKHMDIIVDSGIIINVGKSGKEKEVDAREQIQKLINKCEFEGIKHFKSLNETLRTAKHFGIIVTKQTLYKHKELFYDSNIKLDIGLSPKENEAENRKQINIFIAKCNKQGIMHFVSLQEALRVASDFGFTFSTYLFSKNIDLFKRGNIELNIDLSGKEREIKTRGFIKEFIDMCFDEGVVAFENIGNAHKAAQDFGFRISQSALSKHRDLFNDSKVKLNTGLSPKEKESKVQDEIYKFIKQCQQANKMDFSSYLKASEAAKKMGYSIAGDIMKKHSYLFDNSGIVINIGGKSMLVSQFIMGIEDAQIFGLKIENAQALAELSEDFFCRPFSLSEVSKKIIEYNILQSEVFVDFSDDELVKYIEVAATELVLDEKPDFWIKEIKFKLLLNGFYLTSETILSVLSELGHSPISTMDDSLEKRIRLTKVMMSEDWNYIKYVNKTPQINNSHSPNIYILNSINNENTFMNLWKEYGVWIQNNSLLQTFLLSDLEEHNQKSVEMSKSYKKLFLLDDDYIDILNSFSYEGLAIFAAHCGGGVKKSLSKNFWFLHIIVSGFFVWLSSKNLALSHPKFLQFNKDDSVLSGIIGEILEKHPIIKAYNHVLSEKKAPKLTRGKIKKEGISIHLKKMAASIKIDADLLKIKGEDLLTYCNTSEGYTVVDGLMSHGEFITNILYSYGNKDSIQPDINEGLSEEEFHSLLIKSSVNTDTVKLYHDLINSAFIIVKRRIEEDVITYGYAKITLGATIFLLEYLSAFNTRFSREEMEDILNPFSEKKDKVRLRDYAVEIGEEYKYRGYTSHYRLLFEKTAVKEYKGVYDGSWILGNKKRERTLIRNGLELPVLEIYRITSIYDPPKSITYPVIKSTPKGEHLDLSWWTHDTSPIPVFANWIIGKLPRRMIHIRYLDVNTFMRYDSSGEFIGLFFNTDKNRQSEGLFIRAALVKIIFTDEEIELLENYVNYIKLAYSYLKPIQYKPGGNYALIMPLFPHHEKNDVIAEGIMTGYHVKVMWKTEQKVKKAAKEGQLDEYYNVDGRTKKIERLSQIQIVFSRPANTTREEKKLPIYKYELDDYGDGTFGVYFKVSGGIHNMRHAGATSLLHLGLSLEEVKELTGHSEYSTMQQVYIKVKEEYIMNVLKSISPEIIFSGNPVTDGVELINKSIMPIVESNDSEAILNSLTKNGLMFLSRTIVSHNVGIYGQSGEIIVENGAEIASRYHPDSMWEAKHCCICTVGGQCPEGTNGICSLCPHAGFSAMHTEGIVYEFQKTIRKLVLINNLLYENRRTSDNAARGKLRKQHKELLTQLYGWREMITLIEQQIKDLSLQTDISDNAISVVDNEKNTNHIFGVLPVTLDQSTVELLLLANKLKIKDLDTQDFTNEISHKIILNAARTYDSKTIERMENEGIDWFIQEYGTYTLEKRAPYLLDYIGKIEVPNGIDRISQIHKVPYVKGKYEN